MQAVARVHWSPSTRAFGSTARLPVACPVQVPITQRSRLVVSNVLLNNVEVPSNKRIEVSLQYIYGIGKPTAQKILAQTGVPNKRAHELDADELNKLREELKNYKTEADLRREVKENIQRLKDIGCYRGKRHLMGLPVRGQRTRTNARTRKGKAKTVAGKKKAAK